MIKRLSETENTREKSQVKHRERTGQAPAKRVFSHSMAVCLSCLLFAMSVFYVAQVDSVTVAAGKRELPIYFVERQDNKIAISFDAAWGGDKTEQILDTLDEFGVRTTFFLVDIWTERFPELTKEIAARGHEIGNHSTTHAQMSKQSREEIVQELKVMSDHVESLTGTRPTLFRPPYGDYNNLVVTTARAEGYQVIQWSVDSLDWKNKGVEDLISRSTKGVKGGDIVLFHNDSEFITQALPEILRIYQEKGLEIVPVSELIYTENWTIDHQGQQKIVPASTPEVE